jgi:hypothetical protein
VFGLIGIFGEREENGGILFQTSASLAGGTIAASISDFFSDSLSPRQQPRYRNVRCSIS